MGWLAQLRWDCVEQTQAGLEWLARRRDRAPNLPAHLEIGIKGEDLAYFHVSRKGYEVVARRWSAGNIPGDVDLIAWQDQLLCFFEVKTRTAHDATAAEVAADQHKRKVLRRLAHNYVRQLPQPIPPQVRFDVISVYLLPGKEAEIQHFENAFGWNEHRRHWE
jgi:putative endonuclease